MSEQLNEYLADQATLLVRNGFTGVRAEWWWERRIGGGIEICQELDPTRAARDLSKELDVSRERALQAFMREIGVDDPETVVLTFEIPGDATADEAHGLLSERSEKPEGLAASLYERVRATLRRSPDLRDQ